ncbi:MAG: NYN domain-containing protein, partial [Jiangellaceae bacterium]
MTEQADPRVAVYIDFDNIVISRYDQLHGRVAWRSDNARLATPGDSSEAATKLVSATVDVGAILDYASSFGTVALSRAYADWSVPANASYRAQLVDRAVDLTQLFTTTKALKNGADIRLSVDVLEDLFRLPDLTHVVIVAGDSDYIALAQRCKRLGRFVIGIGVAGGTSPALIAACDEFELYDAIPGAAVELPAAPKKRGGSSTTSSAPLPKDDDAAAENGRGTAENELSADAATKLLVRALELGHAKDDAEWLNPSAVKSQIKRMDPSFNEKLLGFKTFTDFVLSRDDEAEVRVEGQQRSIRRRETPAPAKAPA